MTETVPLRDGAPPGRLMVWLPTKMVLVTSSTATASGPTPTCTSPCSAQPACVLALHADASNTDIVRPSLGPFSSSLVTYTVCVNSLTATSAGPTPTLAVGGRSALHPSRLEALHLSVLIIDT